MESDENFVFRKNDDIGSAAAEDDVKYLEECFIDVGDLRTLLDCQEAKRIVVGRTGTGKSALLTRVLNTQRNVIQLSPHSLSLNYIANNGIIRFFEQAGVNLTAFYMLLWKHVFVVELLRAKYKIKNEEGQRQIMARLAEMLYKKDRTKEAAIEYLTSWGDKFWVTADDRLKELTERITKKLSGSVDVNAYGAKVSGGGAVDLTSEQRSEIVQRGQKAVSEVQIRELERIIDVLGEDVFSDEQDRYYLVIDTLDEEWADDRIKYRLIKALIDTIRSFRRIPNIKIVIALRQDLLQKVVHSSPDVGFQEEKFESLYLYLQWSRQALIEMLEVRMNCLIRRRYTSKPISLMDILPSSVDNQPTLDYLLDRTLLRPRDAIMFLNACIDCAEGRPRLTANVIKHAEEEYSLKRLQSVAQEWKTIYPNLLQVSSIFRGFRSHFPVSDITQEILEERYGEILSEIDDPKGDSNTLALDSLYSSTGNFNSVRNSLVRNFHQVGLIGIKPGPTSTLSWSFESRRSRAPLDVRPIATIHIHPMFHRALGIRL